MIFNQDLNWCNSSANVSHTEPPRHQEVFALESSQSFKSRKRNMSKIQKNDGMKEFFRMYESLQNDITAELRSRERGNLKMRKKEDESLFFADSCCQCTFLILSKRLSDLVKVPFWPCHLTEMIASERLSDRQYRRNFIVKLLLSWRKKRHTSVLYCISDVYKMALKIAKLRAI